MRTSWPRCVLAVLALATVASCTRATADADTNLEPRAVVLTLDEAPEWAKEGATVEVRDEHDAVLLTAPLSEAPPTMFDLTVSPSVHRLAVAVRAKGHVATADAEIDRGYASCKVH